MRISSSLALLPAFVLGSLVGCSSGPPSEPTASDESMAVSDVVSMSHRPDGQLDVVCRGVSGGPNYTQIVTQAQLLANDVCNGAPAPPAPPPSPPGAALVEPACGAAVVTTSKGADRALSIGPRETKTLATLGAGQIGSTSFHFEAGQCFNVYSQPAYANWRLTDGAGGTLLTTTFGRQDFQNVTLPVTIEAWGSDQYNCVVTSLVKNIAYTTTETSCIAVPKIRTHFQQGSWQGPLTKIGDNIAPGTKLTFSAKARFFQNFTAPSCARVWLAGGNKTVELGPSSLSTGGLVELDAPIHVLAVPSCASSRKVPAEDDAADFELELSHVALGAAL